MNKLPLIAGLALILAVSDVYAQQRRTRPPTSPKDPSPVQVSFDSAVEHLPPKFSGHPIREIINSHLQREREKKKGEFEKTDDHKVRLRELETQPLLGELSHTSIFAFSFAPDTQYDADAETLAITAKVSQPLHPRPASLPGTKEALIEIESRHLSSEQYAAQNIYGAVFEVKSSVLQISAVNIMNRHRFRAFLSSGGEPPSRFAFKIRMPVDMAKTAKDNLRVLFICRLVTPTYWNDFLYKQATFDSPREITAITDVLDVELQEIWFYFFDSGFVSVRYQSDK